MTDELDLGLPPAPDPPLGPGLGSAPPGLSRGARITQRRNLALEAGRHPLTGLPLLVDGTTCKTCASAFLQAGGARSYWKCRRAHVSSSEVTDLRVGWPACNAYEPACLKELHPFPNVPSITDRCGLAHGPRRRLRGPHMSLLHHIVGAELHVLGSAFVWFRNTVTHAVAWVLSW